MARTKRLSGLVYTVVTFGFPGRRSFYEQDGLAFGWTRDLEKAKRQARAFKGQGTCTNASVYECDSVSLARSADFSRVRDGERIVYSA